ncbi:MULTISPECIES: hypothetical protein [Streptomyces]|uniref:hypothetical protein n=1 Tax=Streptomyces TaxID=1883 RepID=UPI0022490B38|nr:hypothetical protein [Streptomyces sp. JHD 1]MCX2970852.1 hypothetical protein [Streptomyces sp. JHD 1]
MRRLVAEADEAITCDWTDTTRLCAALRFHTGVPRTSVFGFDAAGAMAAARANAALRLPGNPPGTVRALTDPVLRRELANAYTPFPVRAERCRADELAATAARVGYPCVARTAGGDLHVLRTAPVATALARLLAAGEPDAPLLVEEQLTGPLCTASAHSYGGAHTVLALAPHDADAPTAHAVARLLTATLDAVDHRVGLAHVSAVLTPHGPRLRDAGPGPGPGADPAACYATAIAAVLDLPQPAHRAAAG